MYERNDTSGLELETKCQNFGTYSQYNLVAGVSTGVADFTDHILVSFLAQTVHQYRASQEDEMFCQNCNYRIRSGTSFCTWCGLSIAYTAHPRVAAAITIAKTLRLLSPRNSTKRPLLVSFFAIVYIITAIPALLNGFFSIANTLYAVNNTISAETTSSLGFGLLLIALGILLYSTGTGLWKLKRNSRIVHMILSAFSILTMIGAPIGVLMLWYFSKPEIRNLFAANS